MQGNKLTKYIPLGIAVLFGAAGLGLLPAGGGWLLIGIALCAFAAFCYLAFFASSAPSRPAKSQRPIKPSLKEQQGEKVGKSAPSKKKTRSRPVLRKKPSTKKPSIKKPSVKSTKPAPPKFARDPFVAGPETKKVVPAPAYNTPEREYKGLFRLRRSQKEYDSFAHFYYQKEETPETPFQQLIDKAATEYWNYRHPEFQKKNENMPILMNYLSHTFLRLQEQKKIKLADNKNWACFDTGLLTPDDKSVFGVFKKNYKASKENDRPDWWYEGWFDSEDSRMERFGPLPPAASYIEDDSNLRYNEDYTIEIANIEHIVDDIANHKRLPSQLQNENRIAKMAIKGAVEDTLNRCKHDPGIAIPGWYFRQQRVQLLLPLYITSPARADLALIADIDDRNKTYIVRTALTLDMAYHHARLIARPDRKWLDP